ncbi:MAG: hypothetical protein K0S78_2423, partial [Thermomicrobiales bacterium]|nr:hypothetical protein [Thermomicrobiales bacterium]
MPNIPSTDVLTPRHLTFVADR